MPTIDYRADLRVLVAVRGHPFDRMAFDRLFESMPGVAATMVDQPAAAQLMTPAGLAHYQALVLYDMPGLDFAADAEKPAYVDPPPALRDGFDALLASGIGIVALHHALAGWPSWPAYSAWLGGRFLYRPDFGKDDSGYRHDVAYTAENAAPNHPVMAGIPASFDLRDELYLMDAPAGDATPLLRARHAFLPANFHSAAAAMQGRMNDNEGWSRAPGTNVIGWAREISRSRLVYLQPGHDRVTYENPVYQRLVLNALIWVSRPRIDT
jgi:type 1 glutamine amidotransferase